MDYWPNEDAVVWFVDEVFPVLRQSWPDARFHIVGGRPTDKVRSLARIEGVDVTGRVADVKPYLQHADAVVAPMHIARGIQNKVLEAMSMARPVVVTSQGLEGIDALHEKQVLVADDSAGFVAHLDAVFRGRVNGLGAAAREKVVKDYSWESKLPALDQWLPGSGASA
jgi:glycosyltransferase involved in cell wall biosynthesis